VNNGEDPTARRRQDREAMTSRDAQAWRLMKRGWSVRAIGRELGMPASSVQRCLQRAQKRVAAELDAVLARYDDGDMTAERVQSAADVERCDPLERYRLRYFWQDSPQRLALVGWAQRHPQPPRTPDVYPVRDGPSWRERCDAAMADDSGTVDSDDW
jgi:hypothetical protein